MAEVKDIKILNFNDKAYAVDEMSPQIQELVRLFNIVRRREADLTEKYSEEVTFLRLASDGLFREMNVQFNKEQQELAAEAQKTQSTESDPS